MSDYVIIDTDVFSAITSSRATATRYEAVLRDKTQALTFVSIAELLYGARHAGWGERKRAPLRRTAGPDRDQRKGSGNKLGRLIHRVL
ncbi:hypothetical protein [Frankia tisae]|uniref:hypothetical protein n=1 Tax=Frankia tisae TaxID=2950104 RepID=UPI0021C06B90|nr:hypothetical protein [Frankia tisae]